MATSLIGLAETHDFQKLFIAQLHWAAPDHAPVTIVGEDGTSRTATNVSSYAGIRVWVCPDRPGAKLEAQIDRALAKVSTDRIVIFHTADEQVWRWPVRRQTGQSVTARLTSHRHRNGQANPKFQGRLNTITLPTDRVLDANTVVAKVRAAFDVETQNETKHASQLMARMYAAMEKAYPANADPRQRDHDISLTLARVLFLMFGDDTEMWRTDAFRDFIHQRIDVSGTGLTDQLDLLFKHLNDPAPIAGSDSPEGFAYVNGGIFAEPVTLPALGKEFRDVILEACTVDWSTISPAIFGSMFQSVRDAETRRKLGEHYTSETNILRTLNPLFLDELRTDLAAALVRDTELKQINALNTLWKRLGGLRFMDPACGCGNFIIVAYRELRDLELQVMEALLDRQHGTDQMTLGGDLVRGLRVTLDHFYGIELDEWPARIAATAMFLIDRQCDLKLRERFGEAPQRLPLRRESKIASGRNALREDWETICPPGQDLEVVLAGNPPFVGMARMDAAQQADNRHVFSHMPEAKGQRTGRLDYVACWYPKAIAYMQRHPSTRCAFVSTNSLTQGDQARAFDPILRAAGVSITFAYRTFSWRTESVRDAVVHCVIIGLAMRAPHPTLFTNDGQPHPAKHINFYLLDSQLPAPAKRSRPPLAALPKMSQGSKPWPTAGLLVEPAELNGVDADPVARRFLRPFVQTTEMVKGTTKHCIWMPDRDAQAIAASSELRHRFALVAAERGKPSAHSVADIPTNRFAQVRQPSTRYLAVPEVSSVNRDYLPIRYYNADVIAGNKLMVIEGAPLWVFAVLSSRAFTTWVHLFAGRMKSDPSISPDLTYNAFPWRQPSALQQAALEKAAHAIHQAREDRAPSTLTYLYAPARMPEELLAAHGSADQAVAQLLKLPTTTSDLYELGEILLRQHHSSSA